MNPLLIIRIIRTGAQIWASASIFSWLFQEELIFAKKNTPTDVALRLADNEICIDAESGIVLHGWQHAGNPQATAATDCDLLIYFGSRKEEVSHHIVDNSNRFSCPQWYINYRGYGQSDGEPSCDALRADALHVYDAAVLWMTKNKNNAAPKICVLGYSLGSHMATHVAANRQVHKLILVTPFDNFSNVANTYCRKIIPVKMLLRHPFNTLDEAPKVRAKTLFMLAETDKVVPHNSSHKLIAAWHAPRNVEILPDTTHENIETPVYWQKIAEFMAPDSLL